MIELITGLPRSGKTSLLVHRLMTHKDFQDRPIYVSGIPKLNIDNDNITIIDEGGNSEPFNPDHRVDNWHEWLPDLAILIVDECQRFFRPRASTSTVPAHVAALETHGHRGVDMVLITQHPRLIDVNVKSFIERHQNIKMTPLGVRNLQEWSRCANPDSVADNKDAMKSVFKVKTDSFDKYKSAVGHDKMVKKRHWIFYFAIALIPIIPLAIWFAYYSYTNATDKFKGGGEVPKAEAIIDSKSNVNNSFTGSLATTNMPVIAKGSVPTDYVPSIEERPETKPIYDNIKQVQAFEFPNMCIESKARDECKCYSHQATLIKEIPKQFCKEYVENGIFNPYKARDDSNRMQPVSNNSTG